ncbi:hypothetical protein RE628_01970 [Paenibacillus sp. D2_2]|uniref:hypothetical protein n=1 Tax=Paenibacillus sp. D2_2 TaxID=3073092 RepID=UPI0028157C7E|nr:hypothetical protein [Paenibacillus sp. D2_2]WMT41366.1 hypothetical protein RE628_01970 [Paenibacillus sp. D2_2]
MRHLLQVSGAYSLAVPLSFKRMMGRVMYTASLKMAGISEAEADLSSSVVERTENFPSASIWKMIWYPGLFPCLVWKRRSSMTEMHPPSSSPHFVLSWTQPSS